MFKVTTTRGSVSNSNLYTTAERAEAAAKMHKSTGYWDTVKVERV